MNPPSLTCSKYFTPELLFQLVTVNSIELLPTCIFSKLNLNELKNLNCICRDLIQSGSWIIGSFYYLSILNNNFKEIMNCKNVNGKLY